MSDEREHVAFETLNDLVDGKLDDRHAAIVREHIAVCRSCATEHRRLVEVLDAARAAPDSMTPPDDLWPELRARLESRKTIVLPSGRTGGLPNSAAHPTPTRRPPAWLLGVAAILLVILSSGITALVLRAGSQPDGRLAAVPPERSGVSPSAPLVLPAGFRQTEIEYNRTIQDLLLAVNAQRERLSPETVRTVEHSLAVVDSAIAEARGALLADPNNRVLVDLLSANYQRKLDLLRRASELGPRT